MEFQKAEVQTLVDLGLSSIEAKIYFNLARSGPSSAAVIARQSKVDMSHVHETVAKLHDLGLVESIFSVPTLFKAASADQTLKLLKSKNGQLDNVGVDIEPLIDGPRVSKRQARIAENKFVLIPQNDAVLKRVEQAIKKTLYSMDFIASWKFFSQYALGFYPLRPIRDCVRCRCILEHPSLDEEIELVNFVKQQKSCEFKFTSARLSALLAIFDKKEILVVEEANSNLKNAPALWTNNENLVTISQNYFDSLWLKAKDEPVLSR